MVCNRRAVHFNTPEKGITLNDHATAAIVLLVFKELVNFEVARVQNTFQVLHAIVFACKNSHDIHRKSQATRAQTTRTQSSSWTAAGPVNGKRRL